jgi:hypothetical protein
MPSSEVPRIAHPFNLTPRKSGPANLQSMNVTDSSSASMNDASARWARSKTTSLSFENANDASASELSTTLRSWTVPPVSPKPTRHEPSISTRRSQPSRPSTFERSHARRTTSLSRSPGTWSASIATPRRSDSVTTIRSAQTGSKPWCSTSAPSSNKCPPWTALSSCRSSSSGRSGESTAIRE